jgi:hypothetical protein
MGSNSLPARNTRSIRPLLFLVPLFGLLIAAIPAGATSAAASSTWVKDSTKSLDIFAPDEATDYYFDGYSTASGARTLIAGRVPTARYWSYIAYPSKVDLHDTEIHTRDGRYTITITASCQGVRGNCMATGTGTTGIVILRLYVPIDLQGAGTGGVPLPSITYHSAAGRPETLSAAAGSDAIADGLAAERKLEGTLPAVLTEQHPAAPAVPEAVVAPAPRVATGGQGAFANPDNSYEVVALNMLRGNLVVTAKAPTYQNDTFPHANHLNRSPSAHPDVRYWSVCVQYPNRYTGSCLRDEQIKIARTGDFTVIVAPTCPVHGYRNCLPSGPVSLAKGLLLRNMLPSKGFTTKVFSGAYALQAHYVARPG